MKYFHKYIHRSQTQWAFLSMLVYIFLRLLFHFQITVAGFIDGGAVSYETFYQFAFANELARTGSMLLFRNPFGTLDTAPYLINIYSSILHVLRPLYSQNFFVFDIAIGSVGVFIGAYYLLKIIPPISKLATCVLLFGGGVNFIAATLFKSYQANAEWTVYWGLNVLTNQISTPEIVYHALFFWGIWALLNNHRFRVLCIASILAIIHPFTAITFGVAIFAWCAYAIKERNSKQIIIQICALAIAFLFPLVLFNVVLPHYSQDAKFFMETYRREGFIIYRIPYILSLIIPIVLVILGFFLAKTRKKILNRPDFFIFSAVAFFCMFVTLQVFFKFLPQPAHWSRVYPYAFLFGIYAICTQYTVKKRKLIVSVFIAIAVLVSIIDNVLALHQFSTLLVKTPSAPIMLTYDQSSVLQMLKKNVHGNVIYLHACGISKEYGNFEYSIMSHTLQNAQYGHRFFSPYFEDWKKLAYPCNYSYKPPKGFLENFDYIIIDTPVLNRMHIKNSDVLYQGKDLLLLKTNWKTK